MYGGSNYNQSHHQHHHYPSHQRGVPAHVPPTVSPESAHATEIFEQFIAASTFKSVLHHYRLLCNVLKLKPTNFRHFYPKLKSKIRSWKAQALWTKFDKRALHKCYNHGKACLNTKVLIIGSGPCGLRSAIEAQLLGAKVVVVEKRDRFSRNNVIHLWPFVIADLKALGAKKFYGKFCAGAIDHISIRQLQCMLLKVALILGVEVFEGVAFEELVEPTEDQSLRIGWHARFTPTDHPVNQYEFDVLIGADGKRNTLIGFKRKEFRGKLAIAITANFINKHTEQEARVQEISGVAFIFNQKFFKDLYADTGIDLENIVYYKDETHYFVMTAKKHSLIDKGVILRDLPDTQQLLHPNNVDRKALMLYASEAADFSTGYQMPHLEFAVNHYGKPDIAMFDFTSMFAAENACRVIEKRGHKLLQCLVGDSLLEPFWPTGSGCARGFLSSFDACWAMRSWATNNMDSLEVIAERESIYRLLAQTTPENLGKDITSYTLEPSSRYPTINLRSLLPFQVRHLRVTDEPEALDSKGEAISESHSVDDLPRKRKRKDSLIHPDTLLTWCQKQVAQHSDIDVPDLSSIFKDGRALCAILHHYRPDLIDMESLIPMDNAHNCLLAFDIFDKEFGIPQVASISELTNLDESNFDKTSLVSYLSQIYGAFRGEIPHSMDSRSPFKTLKAQSNEHLDFGEFPSKGEYQDEDLEALKETFPNFVIPPTSDSRNDGRLSCKIVDEAKLGIVSKENLQKNKKRRNQYGTLDKIAASNADTLPSKQRMNIDQSEDFSDRVKDLEAKFKGEVASSLQQKPKDLMRAVGKLEKTDWNLSAIERKIENDPKVLCSRSDRERVPQWNREIYNDKIHNFERRLRESGENEERIAKYLDIDASLKRLERKLREGSTLDTGLRGHNKVSNLASQLSSKLTGNDDDRTVAPTPKQTRTMVLPTSGSDLCYFCGTRVYLVERLSSEGKFFHRQCFKCSYCGALLRLGNYIYDRENRYGGKFFCIPHFGLVMRSRGHKKAEGAVPAEKETPLLKQTPDTSDRGIRPLVEGSFKNTRANREGKLVSSLLTPPSKAALLDDRGTTPERVEFENSIIEHSDEDEYLSEEEWTDRNFGASANELDDDEDDDDSDYSDLSDEEVDEDDLETSHQLTADQTRQLAETWKRRYSNDLLEGSDDQESLSESEVDDLSEEHGAEGDESQTATEGEIGNDDKDEDDDDDDDDIVRRARELRRQELNINVEAPPRKAETSDSGSETEVASDEESDTQIDTDSEFAEDQLASHSAKAIPTIVIHEMVHDCVPDVVGEVSNLVKGAGNKELSDVPKVSYVSQVIDLSPEMASAERSASLTNLTKMDQPNPHTEQLRRLLKRTESTEAVSAHRNNLRRQYLLGNNANVPRKSVSNADLGNKFKSFMDKISETQKKLNPAPEPSPAMQAFLNSSSISSGLSLSPSSPLRSTLLKDTSATSLVAGTFSSSSSAANANNASEPAPLKEESSETSKSEEGKLFVFSEKNEHKFTEPVDDNKSSDLNFPSVVTVQLKENVLNEVLDTTENNIQIFGENFDNISNNNSEYVDAKNIETIESLHSENVEELISNNIHFVNDIENNEAFNIEILDSENDISLTNVILDGSPNLSPSCEDINIDEAFEELVNDALNEYNQSKALSGNLNNAKLNEYENNSEIKSIQTNLDSFNKTVSHARPNIDKKQGDAGLNISEENKTVGSESEIDFAGQKNVSSAAGQLNIKVSETLIQDTGDVSHAEVDLSDWAEDNETFVTTGEEFEDEFNIYSDNKSKNINSNLSSKVAVCPKKLIARIASLESLNDSDSAISISMGKAPSVPCKPPSALVDLENMDFMDTSDTETSPEESKPSIPFGYNKLQECTPTSPPSSIEKSVSKLCESVLQNSQSSFVSDKIPGDGSIKCKAPVKCKSLETEAPVEEPLSRRSFSEPRDFNELSIINTSQQSPLDIFFTPSPRYEGYIPRFKDRVTPFSLVRDSIDVRKSSTTKPLFTPSKEDVLQRHMNEAKQIVPFSLDNSTSSSQSSLSFSTPSLSNSEVIKRPIKLKDGDLVRDMVLSRITKRSPDKNNRRGSRNALHLSLNSSTSSLFCSEKSPEICDNGTSFSYTDKELDDEVEGSNDGQIINKQFKGDLGNQDVPFKENIKTDELINIKMISPQTPKNECLVKMESEPVVRNVLPATPLTHPENFMKENLSYRLRESMQQLHSPTEQSSEPAIFLDRWRENETSFDPKLDPSTIPNTYYDAPASLQIISGEEIKGKNNKLIETPNDPNPKAPEAKRDRDSRLKELLEERRRKGVDDYKEIRLRDKDTCLKECLEEYRLKRSSAPPYQNFSPSFLVKDSKKDDSVTAKAPLSIDNRQSHRPSLLELESMLVFSSPNKSSVSCVTPSNSLSTSPCKISPVSSPVPTSSTSSTSLSASANVSPSKESNSRDKKSTKKSKDRERRRSLIQVVAGMFSKSEDKKKLTEKTESNTKTSSLSPTGSQSPNEVIPKSPSMKDRFSKLRLSRLKDKKKTGNECKNRSSSVDALEDSLSPEEMNPSSSLPTSPSRTIFSFLSSPSSKEISRNKTSYSEENLSDDEVMQGAVATLVKDPPPSISTPSTRRQKAAIRAAKQAEHKRLRMAQEIQRQLEECDVKTRELEERGINVEKALIGETDGSNRDEAVLMKEWFCLVHEKNALVRWQEELTIKARELELEDRHFRLETELRHRMTSSEKEKTREDIDREGCILSEMISVIDEKNALVHRLEEDRQRCGIHLQHKNSPKLNPNPKHPPLQLQNLFNKFFNPLTSLEKPTSFEISSDTLSSYYGGSYPAKSIITKRKSIFDKPLFKKHDNNTNSNTTITNTIKKSWNSKRHCTKYLPMLHIVLRVLVVGLALCMLILCSYPIFALYIFPGTSETFKGKRPF